MPLLKRNKTILSIPLPLKDVNNFLNHEKNDDNDSENFTCVKKEKGKEEKRKKLALLLQEMNEILFRNFCYIEDEEKKAVFSVLFGEEREGRRKKKENNLSIRKR